MVSTSAIKAVFEQSLGLKDTESCLIITDPNLRPVADAFHAYAAGRLGEKARLIEVPVGKRPGEEPPSEVVVQMLLFDVELLITTRSLSHTTARRNASRNDIRIASMPGITKETANRCLDIDFSALKQRSRELHEVLSRAREVVVRTSLGTDLVILREDMPVFGEKGADLTEYGAFGNLPAGEVCFAPSKTNGVCVIDASVSSLGLLDEPVRVTFKDGAAVSFEGKNAARLKALLEPAGPMAFSAGELGFGTNDRALVCGVTLEDEKSAGTAHIAFGNNLSFEGRNDVPVHIDCVMRDARLFADGREIPLKDRP
jgi:leucyl aminopeptidase (aminopeptidase T)